MKKREIEDLKRAGECLRVILEVIKPYARDFYYSYPLFENILVKPFGLNEKTHCAQCFQKLPEPQKKRRFKAK